MTPIDLITRELVFPAADHEKGPAVSGEAPLI
jgi:hypothetical protein